MSKIICDICGTFYQETAECCPICGCSRDSAADLLGEEVLTEEVVEESKAKGGRFAPKKKKEIFDFDEVNAELDEDEDEDEDEDYDMEEDEDEEDGPRHNTLVVILLTVLIAGLLVAAGFIFVRYFLPNMGEKETVATTAAPVEVVETTTEETTEATIPCEMMTMTNVGTAELNEIGQQFLLHIKVQPENTTDKIVYTSGNESIATVTEDGRITAIAEGETTIYISCGKNNIECPVIVKYVEETVPPTTEETVPETTEETVSKPNVTLKLKKNDISLGMYLKYQLVLDCDLEQNEVEWSSEHPHIATVDENGMVTAVKRGTTIVTAKYGSQEVTCWVRIS